MEIRNIGMNRTTAEDLLENIAGLGGNLPIYIVRAQMIYDDPDDGMKRWIYVGGFLAVTNEYEKAVEAANAFGLEKGFRVLVEYIAPWDALEYGYNDYDEHLTRFATKELGRELVLE